MNSLNIQFNNQLKNVKGLLSEALHSGYMADVTLVSDDLKHMSAHKLILAACSPVFRNILVDDSSQNGQILYLKGISSYFINIILKFVYNGEVNVDALEAPAILKILQEFRINLPAGIKEDEEIQKKEGLADFKCTEIQKPVDNIRNSPNSVMIIKESDDFKKEPNLKKNEMEEWKNELTPEQKDQSPDCTSQKTPCPKCGKLVQHLIRHLKRTHNPNSKKYHCPECSYVSQEATNVKLHRINMHEVDREKKRKYPCEKCGKVLTAVSYLKQHIRSIHENQKETCHICQKQFSSINCLHRHIEIAHEGKRFPCEYCGHQSTQMSSLKMHVEAKHKGVKHTCNKCGKGFSQSGTLNIHIKTNHINS